MAPLLIAFLALVAGIPPAAAQEGAGGADAIADRLRGIEGRLEAINASNTWVLGFSLVIAAVAATAAIYYAKQLRKQLRLAEDDAENRLRPALDWRLLDNRGVIMVSGAGVRPSELTIRVINTGQSSARDVVVYQDARIVGSGTPQSPKMRRLGALGPGESVEIGIPMPAEDLASAMGGGIAYVEAGLIYRDGGGNVLSYVVAGYRSNTISTLFGDEDAVPGEIRGAVPWDGGGKAGARSRAPAPPGASGGGMPPARARSRALQSAGWQARWLAESQGPREDMTREDAEGALAACNGMISEDPVDAAAHRGRATALRALGRHEDALEAIGTAEKLDPADNRTLKEKARILCGLGRRNGAIGALNRALSGPGDDLCVYRELARLHTLLGEYDIAHGMWAAIAGQDPSHESHMGLAHTCMALRQHNSAVIALEKAIDMAPDDAYAHAQKGMAELNDERNEEAVAAFKKAISLDGGLADAHVGLAHALYRLGREAEAADELDRAVAADPENQKAHIDRGVLMLEMGRHAEADGSFAAARRLDPSMLVPGAGAPGQEQAAGDR